MKSGIILIGNDAQVLGHAVWEGRIVDETRSTIHLETKDGIKVFEKDKIKIKVLDKVIDGNDLIGRIEERIKRSVR